MTFDLTSTESESDSAAGRIDTIDAALLGGMTQALVTGTGYLPFGPVRQIQYGDGGTQTRAYDADYGIDAIGGSNTRGVNLDFTLNPGKAERTPFLV